MQATVAAVAEGGPAAVSLRGLAAELGVSHAAPVHHFGDKAGLFTAVATEGFDLMADELSAVWEQTGDFLDTGVHYVLFALSHKGHFEVMFQPGLFDNDDPDLVRARVRAEATLTGPVEAGRQGGNAESALSASLASWSTVHGLATLLLNGNLPGVADQDPETLARHVLAHLRVV
jgi:AcrR family transcriptional regulator